MGVWRLPRYIGLGRARQLILSGDMLGAAAAQAIGMVDEVVADAALLDHAQKTAQRYLHLPWSSVLLSKQQTNRAFDLPFEAALEQYFAAQTTAMQSDDHFTALEAYREEQTRKQGDKIAEARELRQETTNEPGLKLQSAS